MEQINDTEKSPARRTDGFDEDDEKLVSHLHRAEDGIDRFQEDHTVAAKRLYRRHLVEHMAACLGNLSQSQPDVAKSLAIEVIETTFQSPKWTHGAEDSAWCVERIKEAVSMGD